MNTPNNIYLIHNLFTEFASKLYQYHEVYFSYYLRQYIDKNVHNIKHPELMNARKFNMYKLSYERNMESRVVKPSDKSVLDCRDNEEYCHKKIVRNLCGLIFNE